MTVHVHCVFCLTRLADLTFDKMEIAPEGASVLSIGACGSGFETTVACRSCGKDHVFGLTCSPIIDVQEADE